MGKDLKTHVASLYESKHEQERGAFYLSVRCLQRLTVHCAVVNAIALIIAIACFIKTTAISECAWGSG